jgi:acyl-coenzyme A synthetase/AMP-(fatty) acid ligase
MDESANRIANTVASQGRQHGDRVVVMLPNRMECVDELPKTPTGKIQRPKLRETGITANTWDRKAAGYQVGRR